MYRCFVKTNFFRRGQFADAYFHQKRSISESTHSLKIFITKYFLSLNVQIFYIRNKFLYLKYFPLRTWCKTKFLLNVHQLSQSLSVTYFLRSWNLPGKEASDTVSVFNLSLQSFSKLFPDSQL
jgi:hypothetical protein